MENLLLVITNQIFRQGKVPETLKVGLLTPIFENKGLKSQAPLDIPFFPCDYE
jgi:hypothetical protein